VNQRLAVRSNSNINRVSVIAENRGHLQRNLYSVMPPVAGRNFADFVRILLRKPYVRQARAVIPTGPTSSVETLYSVMTPVTGEILPILFPSISVNHRVTVGAGNNIAQGGICGGYIVNSNLPLARDSFLFGSHFPR